jgi:predicted  nucleic acid-binding Zn-ribbon protein
LDEAGEPWSDGPTGHGGGRRQGFPADPHRLQRALLGARFWLIGAGGLGLLLGLFYVKVLMGRSYETTVLLKHEGDVQIGDQRNTGLALDPAAEGLQTHSVLAKIQEELGFEGSLTGLADWIQYETDFRAGTLRFTVSGETGEDAAEYAQVVTNVFMAYHRERQSRRIETEIVRTEKRIDAAEDEAEEARQLYNEFRDEHEISNLSSEQQSIVRSSAQLRANSEFAGLEIGVLEAQVASLEAELASTPKTSFVSGGGSPERAAYDRLRGELVNARASLSPDHPRVQSLQQQVAYLRSQLRAGGGASSRGEGVAGLNATYQVVEGQLRAAKSNLAALRVRQKGLGEMADRAAQRMEGFSDIQVEAAALLAEVNVNERLAARLRDVEALLEDALRDPPSGFVVLNPGAVPEYPVENKMKIPIFLAFPIVSVLLVLLVALHREFRGLRLETPAEVAFWGKGPVLASTPWPNDPQGLGELVASLDDFVPHAKGNLLLIGDSMDESRYVGQLADRMNSDWFLTNESAATPSNAEPTPSGRAPLQTPPPRGPYPIGDSGAHSVALARLPSAPATEAIRLADPVGRLQLEAWDGPLEGQSLRRAARLADRILVLIRSGAVSVLRLNGIQRRIGRERGIGYIVLGLPDELHTLPDRAGDVAAFWES